MSTDFSLNRLFAQFIQEWIDETRISSSHNSSFSSHIGFIYKKALTNLKAYTIPIISPVDAMKVNGIGKTLVAKIEKRLLEYKVDHVAETRAVEPVKIDKPKKTRKIVELEDDVEIDHLVIERAKQDLLQKPKTPPKKKRIMKQKEYVPAYRSGGYAILLALMKSTNDIFMDKSEIFRNGQPLSDSSFDVPDAKSKYGYTAWASMKTLIEKELVYKYGHPARYCLTDDGKVIAEKLLKVTDANMLDPSTDYSSESDAGRPLIKEAMIKRDLIPSKTLTMDDLSKFSRGWSLNNPATYITKEPLLKPIFKNQSEIDIDALIIKRIQKDKDTVQLEAPKKKLRVQEEIERVKLNQEAERKYKELNASPRRTAIITIVSPLPKKPLVSKPYVSRSDLYKSSSSTTFINLISDEDDDELITSMIDMTKSSPIITKRSINPDPITNSQPVAALPKLISNNLPTHLINDITNATPIIFKKHTYDICLVLDTREVRQQKDRSYFQDNLQRAGITCLTRSLSLGDAIWIARPKDPKCYDELMLDVIMERKTTCDLVGSIRDGRWKEQGFRLAGSSVKDVIYLVEADSGGQGNVAGEVNGFTESAIRASHCHSMIANNFFVKLTNGCEDTLTYLQSMTRYLQSIYEGKDLYGIPSRCVSKPCLPDIKQFLTNQYPTKKHFVTYATFQEINMKTKTNTVNDIWTKQLLCIRGISAEKAVSITKHYPTMRRSLRKGYLACKDEKEKENLVRDTVLGVGRLGIQNALSKKIYNLFNTSEYV